MIRVFLLACVPALTIACAGYEICATGTDYTPSANAAVACCATETCMYMMYAYHTQDPDCSGCEENLPTGDYSTQEACEGADLHWKLITCHTVADYASNDCHPIQGLAEAADGRSELPRTAHQRGR